MKTITNAELQERVEAVVRVQDRIDKHNLTFAQQLVGLIEVLETGQKQLQVESDEHRTKIERLNEENDQLREMLHSLLLAIEAGGQNQLLEVVEKLSIKVSALVGAAPKLDELLPWKGAKQLNTQPEEGATEAPITTENLVRIESENQERSRGLVGE